MKFTPEEKTQFVARYHNGESIGHICKETGVARSTLYHWVKMYLPVVSNAERSYTLKDLQTLTKKTEKLEKIVQILKSVPCTVSSPLKEKLNALELLQNAFDVCTLCEALEVSRGTFYNYILRNKRSDAWFEKCREEYKQLIQQVYDENNQIFGGAKIRAILCGQGHLTSTKYVIELMRELGLYSISPTAKKEYLKTNQPQKKNILQQEFKTDYPNQIWVSDITCFKLNTKYFYTCIILDLFSRMIVAYRISKKNSTQLVSATFRQAYDVRSPKDGLIFHSDRGVQYASYSFRRLLSEHGFIQSFSASGKPHDNAVAEAFFASMKSEELYRQRYSSEKAFRSGVDEYISFYNKRKPHFSLNYKSPEQFEAVAAK